MSRIVLVTLGLLGIFSPQLLTSQIYVNINSPCNADCDGKSWERAFTDLQDALALAEAGDQVWVAQGTYHPHPTDRTAFFRLQDSVAVYGGFQGNEGNLEDRDYIQYPTILSGDLNGDDEAGFVNYEDNSYTLVFTSNVSAATIIDGVTFTGGNANESGNGPIEHKSGGAWVNLIIWGTNGESSPIARNCTFSGNKAILSGGAFYNSGSVGFSQTNIINCTFTDNEANIGGAIYNEANNGLTTMEIENSFFEDNNAIETGGAVYNITLNAGIINTLVINTIFKDNKAVSAAGYYLLGIGGTCHSLLTNCNFYGNFATNGGAIYLNGAAEASTEATIVNSIIWGSDSGFDPHLHYSGTGDPVLHISHTLIDAVDCDGMIGGDKFVDCGEGMIFNEDPLLVDPANNDFHISENSPAINSGLNSILDTLNVLQDIDGEDRIMEEIIDLGVDEFFMESTNVHNWLASEGIKLYPNPVQDQLLVEFPVLIQEDLNYTIFNLTGQQIQQGRLIANRAVGYIPIEGNMPNGMYILKVEGVPTSFRFSRIGN